ncbi:MAG: translation initiation factor [Dehalococcoidia bacterium]|nr:translation initiation factor [Dehalococcoidia bacterium]
MPTHQAIQMAKDRGLDLIEVAAQATPPVCRILDYGKFKFEAEKKERQARKGQRSSTLRELRIRPKINEHDLEAKSRMVKRLLDEGDKVRVSVIFRGREITHTELGWKLLQKLSLFMKDLALVEKLPAMEGNMLTVIFAPNKKPAEIKPVVKDTPSEMAVKEIVKGS